MLRTSVCVSVNTLLNESVDLLMCDMMMLREDERNKHASYGKAIEEKLRSNGEWAKWVFGEEEETVL